jgi:uncharacterized protein (DUF433 family)
MGEGITKKVINAQYSSLPRDFIRVYLSFYYSRETSEKKWNEV